ncbi:MAG: polyprenyl diphosphate synthase [Nitrosomonadales bacterium]
MLLKKPKNIPKHIAVIMDGNGRWAKKQNKLRSFGHEMGLRALNRLIKYCIDFGIKNLTVYAFSTENWNRPKSEVVGLIKLFEKSIDQYQISLLKNNIRFNLFGDLSRFSQSLQDKITSLVKLTKNNHLLTFNLAANYGSRAEIVNAVNEIIKIKTISKITDKSFANYLYTRKSGDVDLIIRTGGQKRLSNFMLWQSSYAEIFFTNKLWPEFEKKDFVRALTFFADQKRNYGKVTK